MNLDFERNPCFLDSECECSQLCSIHSKLKYICFSLVDWGKFFSSVAPMLGAEVFCHMEMDDVITWN